MNLLDRSASRTLLGRGSSKKKERKQKKRKQKERKEYMKRMMHKRCKDWKQPLGHTDAIEQKGQKKAVQNAIAEAYKTAFPIHCTKPGDYNTPGKGYLMPAPGGKCYQFKVTLKKQKICGIYKFTVLPVFETASYRTGHKDKAVCWGKATNNARTGSACEDPFAGGCSQISVAKRYKSCMNKNGKFWKKRKYRKYKRWKGNQDYCRREADKLKGSFEKHPTDRLRGSCMKTTGHLKITRLRSGSRVRGQEVPLLWSMVTVKPGAESATASDSAWKYAAHNAGRAAGAFFGSSKLREIPAAKLKRVCDNLHLKEDGIVREGIAKFRFTLVPK